MTCVVTAPWLAGVASDPSSVSGNDGHICRDEVSDAETGLIAPSSSVLV